MYERLEIICFMINAITVLSLYFGSTFEKQSYVVPHLLATQYTQGNSNDHRPLQTYFRK